MLMPKTLLMPKLCRKILSNENRLKNHVAKVHKIEDKVVCEHCAKEMMTKSIKQHVRLLHGKVMWNQSVLIVEKHFLTIFNVGSYEGCACRRKWCL